MSETFKAGDLVEFWGGLATVIKQRPLPTETGEYWYLVHWISKNKQKQLHQRKMKLVYASR